MIRPEDRVIQSSQVILLITIPLSKSKFKSDLQKSKSKLYFGKPKQFAKNESYRLGANWEDYYSNVAHWIIASVKELASKSDCTIDYDVSFKNFKKAVRSHQFNCIFLFAHHIEKFGDSKMDYIEFADGGCPFEEFEKFLMSEEWENKSPFLAICKSNQLETIKQMGNSIEYIGTADWEIPAVTGFGFIKHWVLQMDGKKTILDAYSDSIGPFLKSE